MSPDTLPAEIREAIQRKMCDLNLESSYRSGAIRKSYEAIAALALAHGRQEAREEYKGNLRKLALWIRTPGNINVDDARDECARLLENNAVAKEGTER